MVTWARWGRGCHVKGLSVGEAIQGRGQEGAGVTAMNLKTNELHAVMELSIYTIQPFCLPSASCLPVSPYVHLHSPSPSTHFPLIHLLVH